MTARRRPRPRHVAALLLLLAAAGYLAAHAVYGRHGLASRSALVPRAQLLKAEIARQEAVRAILLRDVTLLSEPAPDADLVAEIARSTLGFAAPDEIVVHLPRSIR